MRLTIPVGSDDHARGPVDAPVTLVEYGDYECPHCGRAYPIVERVVASLRDNVRFVFRHMPLSQIHPHAELAAIAAEAAGEQGRFWEMHHLLFVNQSRLGPESVRTFATTLGLNAARFGADIKSDQIKARVKGDFMSGVRSGVAGTPTFFINDDRFDGSWDEASLMAAIRRAAGVTRNTSRVSPQQRLSRP